MSKRSKKRLNRSQLKRRKRLKEEEMRTASREKQQTLQKQFSPEASFKKYVSGLVVVVFLVLLVLSVRSMIPENRGSDQTHNTISTLLLDRSFEWDLQYPYGYKIIALSDEKIIHTSYDMLPEELKINWKNFSVARIEADQLADTIESIKMDLTDISYAPEHISGLSVSMTISRHKGSKAKLARFGKKEFIVEIIEDNNEYLFCLLGLKD